MAVNMRNVLQGGLTRRKKPPTAAEIEAAAQQGYLGAVPFVDAAYKGDPRTAIGNALMTEGARTDPVAGGWTEGIARALSGGIGGYVSDRQRDTYEGKEKHYGGIMNDANRGVVQDALGNPIGMDSASVIGRAAEGYNANPAAQNAAMPVTGQAPTASPFNMSPQPPGPPPPGPAPGGMPGMSQGMGGSQAALAQVAQSLGPQGMGAQPAPTLAQNPTLPGISPVQTQTANYGGRSGERREATAQASTRQLQPGDSARAPVAGQEAGDPETFGTQQDPYGSYGAVFGYGSYGKPDKPVANMTLGELYDWGKNVLIPATRAKGIGVTASGDVVGTSAAGAYQFTGSTLREIAPDVLGANWQNERYTPEVQEALGEELFNRRKNGNLKLTWAGLPDSRPGAYANMSWPEVSAIIRQHESGGGGSGFSIAGSGGGTYRGGAGVGVAPQVPVPALPGAPGPVVRPSLGERVRSSRLQVAANLLQDTDPNNAAAIYAMSQPLLDQGYTDDQAAKMQRDENESQLTNLGYQSDLSLRNQNASALYAGQIADHARAEEQNYTMQGKQYDAGNTANLQRQQDEAALERQNAKASNKRPPNPVINGYLERRSLRRTMGELTELIKQFPDSVNWTFNAIPPSALPRGDPTGVQTRAAISSFTSNILHKLSGAAVTDSEAQRLLPMLPTMNDTPGAIRDKVERLELEFQGMDQDARTTFSNPDGTSFFDRLEAEELISPQMWNGELAANPGLPEGVTVEVVH